MSAEDGKDVDYFLELTHVSCRSASNSVEELILETNDGNLQARHHPLPAGAASVVWVGGAGGGLDGPAGGMYPRLAHQLIARQIASLRLDYRYPGELLPCVMDTLLALQYLQERQYNQIILVGHSFGGAVVINTGRISEQVTGVVAISSQTYGTDGVEQVSPHPLLLMHGMADEILPHACSRDIYRRAKQPKELRLYAGCRHGLDECRLQAEQDLLAWIQKVLQVPA